MLEKPATVRIAGPNDEPAIYQTLIDLWKENRRGWGFPYRPERLIATIEQATRPDPSTRSNPQDQVRGLIGIADDPAGGKPLGIIGVYLLAPAWYTDDVIPTELFMYVRPEARDSRRVDRDLAQFGMWVHQELRPKDHPNRFPLATGFMWDGPEKRFWQMARLWKMMFKGARPVGVLFWKE